MEKDGYDLLFVVDIQVIQRAFAIPVQASDLEFCGWLRVCLRHATRLYSFWLNGHADAPWVCRKSYGPTDAAQLCRSR
jgi:hypothetical protein